MAGAKYLNGFIYNPINPTDDASNALRKKYANVDYLYVAVKVLGKPAVLIEGKFYEQGERILPGSDIDWSRVKR